MAGAFFLRRLVGFRIVSLAAGGEGRVALNEGYHLAFMVGAAFAAAAATLGAALLRPAASAAPEAGAH